MAGKRGKLASTTDPEYEGHKTVSAAAKAHNVSRQTLSDRINNTHRSRRAAAQSQQILNDAQENAVNKWLVLNSGMAAPLHPRDLRARAYDWIREMVAAASLTFFAARRKDTRVGRTGQRFSIRSSHFTRFPNGLFYALYNNPILWSLDASRFGSCDANASLDDAIDTNWETIIT
ncbi:hypothetical protein BS17DRAFT_822058 [Gyrodon lividus]|nr:hypothetical protein BS17DRAFT_822058 [Gyrodon lividus]